MLTIKQALNKAAEQLRCAGIEYPILEAQILLAHLLGTDRLFLHINGKEPLSAQLASSFDELIDVRRKKTPIAYLTHSKEFLSLEFYVDDRVLIPRPDTEILAEEAIRLAQKIPDPSLLDLCCGSGCIGLSVTDRVRDLHLTLSDISEDALQVACINTTKLDLSDRSELIVSDLFEHIPDMQFDIIASNPPYITAEEMHALSEDILCYEPHRALEGGSDGLEYYRRIIMQAQKFLKAPGHLLLEIGSKQAADVIDLLASKGFRRIRVLEDYAGLDRVVCAVSECAESSDPQV